MRFKRRYAPTVWVGVFILAAGAIMLVAGRSLGRVTYLLPIPFIVGAVLVFTGRKLVRKDPVEDEVAARKPNKARQQMKR